MTDSLSYLIARLEALRKLAAESGQVSSLDPRNPSQDWRSTQGPRLTAHRAQVEALRAEAAPDTPLARISARCDLDAVDEDILLLALAPAIDRGFGPLIAQLRRSFGGEKPDVDVVLSLLSGDLGERLRGLPRLEPGSALRRGGLIVLRPGRQDSSPMARELLVPERVLSELLQTRAEGHSRGAFWSISTPETGFEAVVLPEEDRARLSQVLDTRPAMNALDLGPARGASVVLLTGASGTGKTCVALAAAHHLGRPLMTIDALALSSRVADLSAAIEEILTEARLAGALIFFDNAELLFGGRLQGNRGLPRVLSAIDGIEDVVLVSTQLEDLLDPAFSRRVILRVSLEFPPPKARLTLWERCLPALEREGDLDLNFISEKYEFTGSQIEVAARMAVAGALSRAQSEGGAPKLRPEDIDNAAKAQLRHHLAQLAVRSVTHLTLKDLILPDDLMGSIQSIISAVRNRRRIFENWGFGERLTTGKGLTMLFRGESGTGKTLSAEILASELAMPIYRVAIPRIVSKYIGETEQNLEKAFREAQVAQAILLFDEADAIFTKRVEVGTATDRYSNMEVNLLLQELERFEGVVILTTNLDAAIDDAFDRRLNYKLDFPFPTAADRARIWRRLLPESAPVELHDGELDYLAERFELSGGCIKNVAIRAAYSAAEHDATINIDLLERAAIQEYRELGKLVTS